MMAVFLGFFFCGSLLFRSLVATAAYIRVSVYARFGVSTATQ